VEISGPRALWAAAKRAPKLRIHAIERRAERCGLRGADVEAVFLAAVTNKDVEAAFRALIESGNVFSAVSSVSTMAVVDEVVAETGLHGDEVQALLAALLTGDANALVNSGTGAAAALSSGQTVHPLWVLVKRSKVLKIAAVERRAEEHGLRPGDVEAIFTAAAEAAAVGAHATSTNAFLAAVHGLLSNPPQRADAELLMEGAALDALTGAVSAETGVLPRKVTCVLRAVLTGDLAALEGLAAGAAEQQALAADGTAMGRVNVRDVLYATRRTQVYT
jgi:hypothetical protein